MLQTVSRSYPTLEAAKQVVLDLERHGFDSQQLSLIGRPQADGRVGDGAMLGGAAGAMTGLLAGMGMVTVPGLGPFVAVGWLASSLVGGSAGALTGSIAGGLSSLFSTSEEAAGHSGVLEQGGSLVSVRCDDRDMDKAKAILERGKPIDPSTDGGGNSDWSGSNETVP